MKKSGIINAELMHEIAALGHMEKFLVADAGMPIPQGVKIIDLAVCKGVPGFYDVLNAVLAETQIQSYYIASESRQQNPNLLTQLDNALPKVKKEEMPHSDLKEKSKDCKFAIRTGEYTPFCNVIMEAGVTF